MAHRLTINLDDDTARSLRDFAAVSGQSQSAIVREMISAVAPTFDKSVEMYRRAQAAGAESLDVLRKAAQQADADVMPHQQAFLREWTALLARTSEAIDEAAQAHGDGDAHGHDGL